jgi:hypothetical protein
MLEWLDRRENKWALEFDTDDNNGGPRRGSGNGAMRARRWPTVFL